MDELAETIPVDGSAYNHIKSSGEPSSSVNRTPLEATQLACTAAWSKHVHEN